MSIQSVLEEVDRLDVEISSAKPGDPKLARIVTRIGELQREAEELRGLAQPLVPDADPDDKAAQASTEASADGLSRALASLREAAAAKQR